MCPLGTRRAVRDRLPGTQMMAQVCDYLGTLTILIAGALVLHALVGAGMNEIIHVPNPPADLRNPGRSK